MIILSQLLKIKFTFQKIKCLIWKREHQFYNQRNARGKSSVCNHLKHHKVALQSLLWCLGGLKPLAPGWLVTSVTIIHRWNLKKLCCYNNLANCLLLRFPNIKWHKRCNPICQFLEQIRRKAKPNGSYVGDTMTEAGWSGDVVINLSEMASLSHSYHLLSTPTNLV